MRQTFEPRLVNPPFGDPGLYVDLRDERRALLFDLGDLAALPPRKLIRLALVFVSHAHMDHFVGFDALMRVLLGRKPRLVLWGGPQFVDRVEHRLQAYTWNVVQRYAEMVLEVNEFVGEGAARRATFSSRDAFARVDRPPPPIDGDVIHDEPLLRVRARIVDHGTPCLAFALEEKARVRVARERLAALGVSTGAWLRTLKQAVLAGAPPDTPIEIGWHDRDGVHAITRSVGELRDVVLDVVAGQRVGYVTDLRFTEANLAALDGLLAGVDPLFIESVFLDADHAHAAHKHHLTARQAGEIARRLGARSVQPFHFSPRYEGREDALRAEVDAAWRGRGPGKTAAAAHWEHFEHRADVGVRGVAPTRAGAFEQAALALTAVIVDPGEVRPLQAVAIGCEAADDEALLVAWLNALVAEMAVRRMLFGRFEAVIDGHRLTATAWGEPVEVGRHQPAVEVKGATFTALRVARRDDGGWMAQTVVDV